MTADKKEFFCMVPFETFQVLWTGGVYFCCPAWLPKSVGNLKNSPAMNIWNSSEAQKIRRSILDGTFSYCNRDLCFYFHTDSLPHRDTITDPYIRGIIAGGITHLERGPGVLLLDIDRTCNLWCPSCRTARMVARGVEFQESLKMQEKLVSELLQNISLLSLSGSGDPFSSKLHMDLLTSIESAQYPDLKIRILTNGLLFTPRNWENIAGIRDSIRIVYISIDAARPETYIKIRRGGDFSQLLDNLAFISGLRRDGKLDRLEFHFVVQQGNYREMREFIEWLKGGIQRPGYKLYGPGNRF